MYNARATAYKIDDEKREGHMIFVCEQCAKKSQIGLSDPVAISIYSQCENCGSFYGKELF